MSIEHSLIPAGEQHVVANWQVATVPDLDNLTVTFDDIGKQAWVQGIGHFTLANSDPITWEAASAGVASLVYTAGTKVLTITDTAGATFTATLDGLNTAEVAALISAHAVAADPHGDRAFSIQRANHTGTQLASTISDFTAAAIAAVPIPVTSVHGRTGAVVAGTGDYTVAQVTGAQSTANLSTDVNLAGGAGTYPNSVAAKAYADTKQPLDATLTALAGLNATAGFVVQVGVDNFTKRTLTGTAGQIAITNGAGDTGVPTIGLAASGVTAGTYGSASAIPIPVVDTYGRITSITTASLSPTFSDSAFRVYDNGNATKQLAIEVSGIATTTTQTWTAPNAAINFGDLPAIATTSSNTLSGTRNQILGGSSNTVSGTDNVMAGCTSSDFAGTSVTALGTFGIYAFGLTPFPRQAIILGTSSSPRQVISDGLSHYAAAQGGITCCWTTERTADGVLQYALLDGSNTPSSTNCTNLLLSNGAICSATHEVEFIVTTGPTTPPIVPARTYFAKRKVYVERHSAGVATVTLVTLDTDQQLGDATSGSITCTVGTDQANNRLLPSVTVTNGTTQTTWQASVRITSHHNRK